MSILDLFHDGINEFQIHNVDAPYVCKCLPEVLDELINASSRRMPHPQRTRHDGMIVSGIAVEVDNLCEPDKLYFLSESDVKVHNLHTSTHYIEVPVLRPHYIEVPVLRPIGHCADEIDRVAIHNGQSLWSDSMHTDEKKHRGIEVDVSACMSHNSPRRQEAERLARLKRQEEEGQVLGNSQEIIREKLLELRGMDSLL